MSESGKQDSYSGPDDIRILVASDIHLGYNEKDPIRGKDITKDFWVRLVCSIGVCPAGREGVLRS